MLGCNYTAQPTEGFSMERNAAITRVTLWVNRFICLLLALVMLLGVAACALAGVVIGMLMAPPKDITIGSGTNVRKYTKK